MSLLRREPRSVYRVYAEEEYLDAAATTLAGHGEMPAGGERRPLDAPAPLTPSQPGEFPRAGQAAPAYAEPADAVAPAYAGSADAAGPAYVAPDRAVARAAGVDAARGLRPVALIAGGLILLVFALVAVLALHAFRRSAQRPPSAGASEPLRPAPSSSAEKPPRGLRQRGEIFASAAVSPVRTQASGPPRQHRHPLATTAVSGHDRWPAPTASLEREELAAAPAGGRAVIPTVLVGLAPEEHALSGDVHVASEFGFER
jgi:hypothetical protein